MSFQINKRQPQICKSRHSKAQYFIPSIILGLCLSLGAAAGQSALLQHFSFGQRDQDALALIIKTTPKPSYSLAGSGAMDNSAKARKARALLRGMQPKHDQVRLDAQLPSLLSASSVLDGEDERVYRKLFGYLSAGELSQAQALTSQIKDGVLLGNAQAAYMLSPRNTNVTYGELREWLQSYSDLPQAQDIYKKALSIRVASDKAALVQPEIQGNASQGFGRLPSKFSMAEPVEWKKPQNFAAETLWRSGQYEAVLEKLQGVAVQADAPFESYYPLWVKALSAFAVQDYALAAQNFADLLQGPLPEANRAAAAFWAARSYEKNNQSEEASHYFELAASSPRSFYGILALARNDANIGSEAQEQAPSFTKRHAVLLKQSAAGLRALALLQIGEKDLAEKEALALAGKTEFQAALMALGSSADMPMLAARAAATNTQQANNSYPAMPWKPAGGFTSDPALVAAIAWNESRFNASARNPSGASGLMQIMPDTAERVVAGSSSRLFDPQTSVTLGDKYIQKLSQMNGIDNNLLLVIAGYNCGPGKVQELFQHARHVNDPLMFVETLPLKETREYLQKVLTTYASYRVREGKALTALAALSRGEWPGYDMLKTAAR